MYIIQAEGKDVAKLVKLAKKNRKLKVIKAILVTDDPKLVGAIKANYSVIVLKQDLLL